MYKYYVIYFCDCEYCDGAVKFFEGTKAECRKFMADMDKDKYVMRFIYGRDISKLR